MDFSSVLLSSFLSGEIPRGRLRTLVRASRIISYLGEDLEEDPGEDMGKGPGEDRGEDSCRGRLMQGKTWGWNFVKNNGVQNLLGGLQYYKIITQIMI